MERGEPLLDEPTLETTVDRLLDNTDDAYTFPPFASISPLLRFGGLNLEELRERENGPFSRQLYHARSLPCGGGGCGSPVTRGRTTSQHSPRSAEPRWLQMLQARKVMRASVASRCRSWSPSR